MTANFDRGVDFDDPEYGFKEEDKDLQKVLFSYISLPYANSEPGQK